MVSSAEIWVIGKIAELTNRHSISPTSANVHLTWHDAKDNEPLYTMSMVDGDAGEHEMGAVMKIRSLLGLDKEPVREFDSLQDVEKVVDQALALAPRGRAR